MDGIARGRLLAPRGRSDFSVPDRSIIRGDSGRKNAHEEEVIPAAPALLGHSELVRLMQRAVPPGASVEDPVENRQEDVVATLKAAVMQHMVVSRGAQPSRQPSSEMKAPVNLLIGDEIEREAGEDSNGKSGTQEKLQGEHGKRVQNEDEDDHPGRRSEIDVSRLLRRSRRIVMKPVALDEKSFAPMQEKPVQDVLKTVRVENSRQKSRDEAQEIKLARVKMNQLKNRCREDRAHKKRGDCVAALDVVRAGNFSRSGSELIGHSWSLWVLPRICS